MTFYIIICRENASVAQICFFLLFSVHLNIACVQFIIHLVRDERECQSRQMVYRGIRYKGQSDPPRFLWL